MYRIREALSAEIHFPCASCYSPLNACQLYSPLIKKRHHISEDYSNAINPSRFKLPVAEKIFNNTSVCIHHRILLGTKKDMEDIFMGIKKIRDNSIEPLED